MNSVTPSSNKTDEFVRGVGNAVRDNPISAALIGMGIIWLISGARPLDQMRDAADRSGFDRFPEAAAGALSASTDAMKTGFDAASDGVSRMGETFADAAQNVGKTISSAGSDVVGQADEFSRSAPEMIANLRSNLADLFQTQPLLLGAVGIAIGAGIAASLPASNKEIELLGETSTSFRNSVNEFVSEQSAKAQTVASGVVTAVAEEGRAQGLTLDGLTAAASDAGEKIKRVATHAGESIKGR